MYGFWVVIGEYPVPAWRKTLKCEPGKFHYMNIECSIINAISMYIIITTGSLSGKCQLFLLETL